jgi:hypothetical protein
MRGRSWRLAGSPVCYGRCDSRQPCTEYKGGGPPAGECLSNNSSTQLVVAATAIAINSNVLAIRHLRTLRPRSR